MAIEYDNVTDAGAVTAITQTFAHTCTGANLILFVTVDGNSITGVTYNNVAMTEAIGIDNYGTGRRNSIWYLINPSTGSNNVVVTSSSSLYKSSFAISYTGAKQSAQPDAVNSDLNASANTITVSTTTVADNSWVVGFGTNDAVTPTPGTGMTQREVYGPTIIGDSNGPKTPAGSYSMQINLPSVARISLMCVSFAPFTITTSIKTINGLAKASVKTINGLAIASVKTINGLA